VSETPQIPWSRAACDDWSIRLSLLRRELTAALAEVAQLEKWPEGGAWGALKLLLERLVIETQRLQGIEDEVKRLRAQIAKDSTTRYDASGEEIGPSGWPTNRALSGEEEK